MIARLVALLACASCGTPASSPGLGSGPAPTAIAPSDAAEASHASRNGRGIIAAGRGYVCARTHDGRASCWGELGYQQARGRSSASSWFADDRAHPSPVEIAGLPPIAGIAAGDGARCTWTDRGEVWCWGVIGAGDDDRREPHRIAGLADIVELSGDQADTMMCALRRDGRVACWGRSDWRAWNDASAHAPAPAELIVNPPTLGAVAGLADAVELAVAGRVGCARRAAGPVVCWEGIAPDHVTPIAPAAGAISLAGGVADTPQFAAVLPGGRVVAWGLPSAFPDGDVLAVPALPADVVKVAVGPFTMCAIGAGVACWRPAVGAELVPVAGVAGAVDVAISDHASCARTADGRALCWGEAGWLGDGVATQALAPVDVTGIADAVQIAAGEFTTCARHATGRVSCWGDRLGPFDLQAQPDGTPVDVAGLDDATGLAVASSYACATRAGGTTACWGEGHDGEHTRGWASPTRNANLDGASESVRVR